MVPLFALEHLETRSKFDVSSMDLTMTGITAGLSLMWPQSTCLNQSSPMISSLLWTRFSRSLQNLRIVLMAVSDIGTSGGNSKVVFQFITFLYVSCGVSEQKGGYPINISNMMTPRDHQSQLLP